jgi:hypothetical protein
MTASFVPFISSFLPIGIFVPLFFSISFFFTLTACYLFAISLFFCFLRVGLLLGIVLTFFYPGVCNITTTWRRHSITTDSSGNINYEVTKFTSTSHIFKDLSSIISISISISVISVKK